MKEFIKVNNFEVDDYYGVAILSQKKNDEVQIRLQYDYNKSPINGKPISFTTYEDALIPYHILMAKRKPKLTAKSSKFSLQKPPEKPGPSTLFN